MSDQYVIDALLEIAENFYVESKVMYRMLDELGAEGWPDRLDTILGSSEATRIREEFHSLIEKAVRKHNPKKLLTVLRSRSSRKQ
jgi:hypothetical protein